MRKPDIIHKRDGFTLVELIVVLVIIGILLTLVIPNLTGYIDKAQATSCRKNRAELEKILRYDTLLAEADGTATTMSAVLGSENGKRLTCPSGGTYTYNDATGHLICSISKHNAGMVSTNPIANGVLAQFGQYYADNSSFANKSLDSGAGIVDGSNTQKFNDLLKNAGMKFEDMNIATWAYRPADSALYWTSVDISGLEVSAPVPVMKYNEATGVYSIWTTNIGTATLNDTTYNILKTPNNEVQASKKIKSTDAAKKDYDTMNAIYQAALAEYNKNP